MPLRDMPLRAFTSQLKERARSAAETVVAMVRFLRAYVSARLTPVPVVRDVPGLTLRQLAARTRDLAERARHRRLTALIPVGLVVAAIAIVTIVVSKLTATANNIQTP